MLITQLMEKKEQKEEIATMINESTIDELLTKYYDHDIEANIGTNINDSYHEINMDQHVLNIDDHEVPIPEKVQNITEPSAFKDFWKTNLLVKIGAILLFL